MRTKRSTRKTKKEFRNTSINEEIRFTKRMRWKGEKDERRKKEKRKGGGEEIREREVNIKGSTNPFQLSLPFNIWLEGALSTPICRTEGRRGGGKNRKEERRKMERKGRREEG